MPPCKLMPHPLSLPIPGHRVTQTDVPQRYEGCRQREGQQVALLELRREQSTEGSSQGHLPLLEPVVTVPETEATAGPHGESTPGQP